MERNKKTILLILPLLLIHACVVKQEEPCPSQPDKNLSCYNNYNNTLTCEWNSMKESDQMCTIYARKGPDFYFNSSCDLKPVDISKPGPRKCTMMFEDYKVFQSFSVVPIDLICNPGRGLVSSISYKAFCHIKLDPPQRPKINSTTVSWFPSGNERKSRIRLHSFQLLWKHKDQSWEDAFQQKSQNLTKNCTWDCETKLQADWLIQGEEYEFRVRVMGIGKNLHSVWSDWSVPESLVSPVGQPKPTPDHSTVIFGTAVCAVVITAALAVIYLKQNKTIWIYMMMKFKSQPIPNPAKSFLKDANFQNHLSPTFTLLNPLKVTSVEITSPVDAVTPYRPEAVLLEKIRVQSCYDSTSSGFSNPSHAHLCPSPPSFPSPTMGSLTPCAADTPYGPVCSDTEVKEAEERKEVKVNEAEILELLSKGSNKSKPGLEISDYEKVEKLQVERSRLQSLDSGVCSGEEVSQESLEADGINVTESIDEEEEEESKAEGVFQRLFGDGGNVFSKGSIQVSSEYERVPTLPSDTTEELVSSSEKEEQFSHEESLEDEDKSTVLAPPSSDSSLNFTGPAFSPALQPQQCSLLDKLALMSTSRSVAPSGDGYMPVEQS
ncbi:uncharacterized protein LOC121508393 isoform X2 [Cheilinus undulatus]|uniref:uncharacterized protein LOC121508393 isoform X2 n=1 Tax=Cheilinus undulatus TaxID=241271 RepID=UPI001BD1E1B6|nr:uncharacterized protein LOC121508393 isoform X2 [Cheilinus undulatus]